MTRAEVMAEFFKARPDTWIDGRTLSEVAGCYGWRTRCSDIRRAPFYMDIQNKQTMVVNADGSKYVKSEYRFVPEIRTQQAAGQGRLLDLSW